MAGVWFDLIDRDWFLIEFLCFNLDYSRTEKVQFEDDEYYYYVKAVPKVNPFFEREADQKDFG